MPKVSVLVPVYRTNPDHLREAIRSILGQTFADFELLLLDDCPQDDRAAVVAEFSDPRIRYERNEANMGISPTRNKLIDMAQGEYLAVMDHDDISLPERFARQVAYMDAHPGVGVVSCQVQWLGREGLVLPTPEKDHDIKLALMEDCYILHPAAMLRKSVLTETGIRYDAALSPCEDYDLWCRLIPHTCFHNLQEPLFLYRNHEGNTSHHQAARMAAARCTISARAQAENPALWREFTMRATTTTRIKLFGCIPVLKIHTTANREKAYLFNFIPFYNKKKKISRGA